MESAAGVSAEGGPASSIAFDGFELDLEMLELRHDEERVHIEPQVFDVLAYLAQNPGRVVSREELLDEIWGDRFVSLSALTSRIKSARTATGDDGRTQRVIRTVHGRGFTFLAELSRPSMRAKSAEAVGQMAGQALGCRHLRV